MRIWGAISVSVVLLTLALLLSFTSAVNSPSLQFNVTPNSLSLNWTNNNRQNITIVANNSNSINISLQIHTVNTGLSGNYSQRDQFANSSTNSKYWDSCFYTNSDLDNPLVAINQTGSTNNLTSSMSNGTSLNFTILHNATCPPGRYWGSLTVSNTTNSTEQVNLTVQVDIPIDSTNTLNTTTGVAEFKGTMPASALTYHSYYFNTSSITNATGLMANLTWSSASKDLDLFLVDNTGSLKTKSVSRNQATEQLNFNYLTSNQVWEVRVYGNLSSPENYTGTLFFTTLNSTNSSATTQQFSTINFGSQNISFNQSTNTVLKNEGGVNTTTLSEVKEIYHTESFSSSGSNNHTFLVPNFATNVRVSLNWTGGTNYTLKLYNPSSSLIGTSNDKFKTANVTGLMQEEFVGTSTITSSPNNVWRAEVLNNTQNPDTYTVEVKFYVPVSDWLASNYSSTTVNLRESKTHNFNLTVPTNATSGLYKGGLKYQNNQTLEISFQVNVTTPTLVVNNTYSNSTTIIRENIGSNKTGNNVLQLSVLVNNIGNQLMSLTASNLSNNLTKGNNFMNFSYAFPSSINPAASGNLNINITVNTTNTNNSQGVYTGWIFLNGSAAPYQGFNLTLQVNLSADLTGTLSQSPAVIQTPNQTNNITFTANFTLLNGSSISNNLNMSNILSASITEKSVISYSQSLTSLTNISATLCTGGLCTFNATVPANLVGGRYKLTVNFNALADDGSSLTGFVENSSTLTINETGLNLTSISSPSIGNINEGTTSVFNISVTNYGPKLADDVQINFDKGTCTNTTIETKDSSTGSGSGSTWTADISDGQSQWFRWNLIGGSVSSDNSCSGAQITVSQKSFNNITGISWTVKNTDTSSGSGSSTAGGAGGAGGVGGVGNTGTNTVQSLTITESVDKLKIVQGNSTTTKVKVRNIGTVPLAVTFSIADLDQKITYTVAGSGTIANATEEEYILTFTVPADQKVAEYKGKFKIESGSISDTEDFTIVVLPSEANKIVIEDYNKIFEKVLKSLADRKDNVKTLCQLPGKNPLSKLNATDKLQEVDKLFKESNDILVQLNSALKDDDYLRSQKHADELKEKTDKLDNLLKDLEDYKTACTNIANQNTANLLFYGGLGSILFVFGGLLVYSYFPVRRGYLPGRGFSTSKPRPNVFRSLGRSAKGLGNFFRKEEAAIGHLEKAIAKDYSATTGYLRKEISYEFEEASKWIKLKNKLGSFFRVGSRVRGPRPF